MSILRFVQNIFYSGFIMLLYIGILLLTSVLFVAFLGLSIALSVLIVTYLLPSIAHPYSFYLTALLTTFLIGIFWQVTKDY
jgi:hypothetical protein